MATYAIGDVQGCASELFSLLETIQFEPAKDTLWFAGDLVNRGKDNLSVLRFVKNLGKGAVVVLGNHDLHLIATAYGARKPNRKDTLHDVLSAPDCDELIDWLRQRKLFHAEQGFAMSHAGIPPNWSVSAAKHYAKEVSDALRGDNYRLFFKNMYGNYPSAWDDTLQPWDRLRVITNYFTRMRFCNVKGELDLLTKEGVASTPEGFAPWYELRNTHLNEGLTLLFGHWAALEGKTSGAHYQALDTGCVWGGSLTALCLETMERTSIPCPL